MTDNKSPKLEIVPSVSGDALDIESLWLDAELGDGITDAHWHTVPVGKPRDFFRVHPNKLWRRRSEIFVLKKEEDVEQHFFLIDPKMRGLVPEARPCTVVTYVYRDGAPRLWVLPSPRPDEKDNTAWSSARSAARAGIDKWVRLTWSGRSYATREAQAGYAPDPDWNKIPVFNELVELGFGAAGIIRDKTHTAYRDLVGLPATVSTDDEGL